MLTSSLQSNHTLRIGGVSKSALLTCDRLGLVGHQMFAIDGVKLPANASEERSGSHAELLHSAARLSRSWPTMVMPGRRTVQAQNGLRGTVQALAAHHAAEMRHTGWMKLQTLNPQSQGLGCTPWAGGNGVFAQPR